MPTREAWISFDCAGAELNDVVAACAWRVDPVRSRILDIDEDIRKVRLVNVEKLGLPPDIATRIESIRETDPNEANIAVQELLLGWLLLWIPAEVHKQVRNALQLLAAPDQQKGFTSENISALLEEMKKHKERIAREASGRIIEKPIKQVFEQSVLPRLDSLTVGQHHISSKMSTMDGKLDGLTTTMDGKLDRLTTTMDGKLDRLTTTLQNMDSRLRKKLGD